MATPGTEAKKISFAVDATHCVSGLVMAPDDTRAAYVLAHGAGAGMAHPFLGTMANALFVRGIATLRYQFPYMEAGSRRPDNPALAHATVRAAVDEGHRQFRGVPLIAGGKSFGGRMTSQAQAAAPLPGVAGLIFLGFPLHPPGKPGIDRGEHLADVSIPMLFLQGTRDEFADLHLLEPLAKRLGKRVTLHLVADANHSFKLPARASRNDADIRTELADAIGGWMDKIIKPQNGLL
jgi:predicted alpha/beta-hydrolase family hydrolase